MRTKLISRIGRIIKASFSEKYLLYTNIGISATLSSVGDILEQQYEMLAEEIETWDKTRTRNMGIYGVTAGIFCHHWFKFLDGILPHYNLASVCKKVLLDQIICSPICVLGLFIVTGILERKRLNEITDEIKKKGWWLYKAEWVVWPSAQFVNFYFLPTRFRVLYDNTISLGYDVYTSHVKHKVDDG